MSLLVNFSCDYPTIWRFWRIKFTFSYFELNPIVGQLLENNLHFITYFTHRGQSPDRQQPIKKWSLKHNPFLFAQCIFTYSKNRDCDISLVRVYWRFNRVSVSFSHSETTCNDSKQMTLIFLWQKDGNKCNLLCNHYFLLSLSHQQGEECVVWRDQRTAGKKTTVCEAPMHFIFAQKYSSNRENRQQDTCFSLI